MTQARPSLEERAGGKQAALARLEAGGLVCREEGRLRTTRRFHAAMARAALRLLEAQEAQHDLRLPVAHAVLELFGPDCPDAEVVLYVELLAELEARALLGGT